MYTTAPESIRTPAIHDGLAVASLVLGLLWLGGLGSVLAVIFGHASRGQAKRQSRQASSFATAGCILGWIGFAVSIFVIAVLMVALMHEPTAQAQNYVNCINSQLAAGLPITCTP